MKPIILASSSSFRKSLLQKLQLPFTTAAPDVDETPRANETAAELVQRLSLLKARTVARKINAQAVIIGSDTVMTVDDTIFGKPLTHAHAVIQLQKASGKPMHFYTGLCLLDTTTAQEQSCVETYTVTVRPLTTRMIETYLHKEQPYHSAGSIKAEGLAIALFETMQGKDFNTLLGLPLIELVTMLHKADIDVFT